jgi:hypothetical protein
MLGGMSSVSNRNLRNRNQDKYRCILDDTEETEDDESVNESVGECSTLLRHNKNTCTENYDVEFDPLGDRGVGRHVDDSCVKMNLELFKDVITPKTNPGHHDKESNLNYDSGDDMHLPNPGEPQLGKIISLSSGNKHTVGLQIGAILALQRMGVMENVEHVVGVGMGVVTEQLLIQAAFAPAVLGSESSPKGVGGSHNYTRPGENGTGVIEPKTTSFSTPIHDRKRIQLGSDSYSDKQKLNTLRRDSGFRDTEFTCDECTCDQICHEARAMHWGEWRQRMAIGLGELRVHRACLRSFRRKFKDDCLDYGCDERDRDGFDRDGFDRVLAMCISRQSPDTLGRLDWPAWALRLLARGRDFAVDNLERRAFSWMLCNVKSLFTADYGSAMAHAFQTCRAFGQGLEDITGETLHPPLNSTAPPPGSRRNDSEGNVCPRRRSVSFQFGGKYASGHYSHGGTPELLWRHHNQMPHLVSTGAAPVFFGTGWTPSDVTPAGTRYRCVASKVPLRDFLPALATPSEFGEWDVQDMRAGDATDLGPLGVIACDDIYTSRRMQDEGSPHQHSRERVFLLDSITGTKCYHRLHPSTRLRCTAVAQQLGNISPLVVEQTGEIHAGYRVHNKNQAPSSRTEIPVAGVDGRTCAFAEQISNIPSMLEFSAWIGNEDVRLQHVSSENYEACVNFGFLCSLLVWANRDKVDVLKSKNGRGPAMFLSIIDVVEGESATGHELPLNHQQKDNVDAMAWNPFWTLPFPDDVKGRNWVMELVENHRTL